MLEGVDGVLLHPITPWGIVGLFVLSILRGWLLPRWWVAQQMSNKDEVISLVKEDANRWRTAAEVEMETSGRAVKNNEALIKQGEVVPTVLEAIRRAVE